MSYSDPSLTPREIEADEITAAADLETSDPHSYDSSALVETPAGGVPRMLRAWSRYEVRELLGAGGMGAVYKAYDPQLQRLLALKIIHPRLGMVGASAIAGLERRLLREARLQAALDHPHICKVYEVGRLPSQDDEPGNLYIAMPLIAGEPLHRAQADMSMLDKLKVIRTVAEALHCAHREGLIHRDIKPSKI